MAQGKSVGFRRRLQVLENLVILEKKLLPEVSALVFQVVRDARNEILQVPHQDELALSTSVVLAFIAVEGVEKESYFDHVLNILELLLVLVWLDLLVFLRHISLNNGQHSPIL